MKATIDNMLTHVYELEGLLLVMQRHHDDVPPEVVKRYKEKAAVVAQEAQQLSLCDMESPATSAPSALKKEDEHVIIDLEKEAQDSASRPMFDAMSLSQGPKPGHVSPPLPPTTRSQVVPPSFKTSSSSSVPPAFKPKSSQVEKTETGFDVTSAFSINDRFLFLRELFDNDQLKFDDAIHHIKSLKSVEDVKSYVSGELHWDMSRDVVEEFMRLIALGYSQGIK